MSKEVSKKVNRWKSDVLGYVVSNLDPEEKAQKICTYFAQEFDAQMSEIGLAGQNYSNPVILDKVKFFDALLESFRSQV